MPVAPAITTQPSGVNTTTETNSENMSSEAGDQVNADIDIFD